MRKLKPRPGAAIDLTGLSPKQVYEIKRLRENEEGKTTFMRVCDRFCLQQQITNRTLEKCLDSGKVKLVDHA